MIIAVDHNPSTNHVVPVATTAASAVAGASVPQIATGPAVAYPYVIATSTSGTNLNTITASNNTSNNNPGNSANNPNPNMINAAFYHQMIYQQQQAYTTNSNFNQNIAPSGRPNFPFFQAFSIQI